MVDKIVLNHTNTELLVANIQNKRRAQYTGIQYDSLGAYVLSLEDIKERRQ